MKKFLLPFVIVPAIVLILLTVLRAYLEIHSPDDAVTKIISANALSGVWILVAPIFMLKYGLSLMQGLGSALLFFVVHRLAIGAVYAMAWADKWKVEGTDTDVRYVTQITQDIGADADTMRVLLQMTFLPAPFGVAMVFIVWCIAWTVSFRGKRPFAHAANQAG